MIKLDQIQHDIATGRTQKAIDALQKLDLPTDLQNTLTVIAAKWANLNTGSIRDVIHHADKNVEFNKVNDSLVQFLAEVSKYHAQVAPITTDGTASESPKTSQTIENIGFPQKSSYLSLFFWTSLAIGLLTLIYNQQEQSNPPIKINNIVKMVPKKDVINVDSFAKETMEYFFFGNNGEDTDYHNFDSLIKYKQYLMVFNLLEQAKSKTIQPKKLADFEHLWQCALLAEKFDFERVEYCTPTVFIAEKDGKTGVINQLGETTSPFHFYKIWLSFKSKYERKSDSFIITGALSRTNAPPYGIIKLNGKEVIPPVIESISLCRKNSYIITEKNKEGLIDLVGNIKIPVMYEFLGAPDEAGYLRVSDEGTWGYVNMANKILIPLRTLDYLGGFDNNIALVRDGKDTFYINRKGNRVSKPK